ncbi:MAG: type II secretion system protein M [Pseudomonadales bacterium]|nr:type II secretion system protein M [Pseudomonadales bacterium]
MTDAASGLAEVKQQFADIKLKYYSLSPRDRGALVILSVFLGCVLFFYLVWSPVNQGAEDAYDRYQNKVKLMAWMKANESVAKRAANMSGASAGSRGGKSILSLVNATSGQNGVSLKRFEPKGEDGLRIWLENVSFDAMLKWLGILSNTYGIVIANITVESQKESGKINATIILSG